MDMPNECLDNQKEFSVESLPTADVEDEPAETVVRMRSI